MTESLRELDRLLSEPIACVLERERSAFDSLLAQKRNRVVLFGAGNLGRKVLSALRSIGVEPLAFSDNADSKWCTEIDGIAVLPPSVAVTRFGGSALFVVTIWSIGQSYMDIHTQLKALGCDMVVPTSTLRWKFADRFLPDLCQDLPHKLYQQAEHVRSAALLWSDDFTRAEYLKQIRWRARGDHRALSPPHQEESYFPDTLFRWSPEELFVDCGAYVGDTGQRILDRESGRFKQIFALEPDPGNFARLQRWHAGLDSQVASRIETLNLAVASRACEVRFKSSGTQAAAIDDDGDVVAKCVALDQLLGDVRPTYIKMDIEGAEVEAIEGAAQIIERHQPLLAICVYHRQDHLWRIPLLIHSLRPDYRFFLRPHEADGYDTVCYAVPEHRLCTTAKRRDNDHEIIGN